MKIVDKDGNLTFVSSKSKEGVAELERRKSEKEKAEKAKAAKK